MAKRTTSSSKSKKKRDAIKVVIKDNQLVEAKYMFNIWETRFFLTLITMIDKQDEEDKVYRIWFNDIKKNFNINSNKSYDLLREAAISLASKSVDIPSLSSDGKYNRNTKRRLLKFVNYLEKGQTGADIVKQEYIDVAIDKEIQPFLLHVKKNFDPKVTRYTSYELVNAEKLKPYAVRIYELMKQFEHKGFRTIRVQNLKEMFLITNEYPRFSTFNQSVILPSIRAINKHTDITVPLDRIQHIKKGRRVDSIRFVILTKTKVQVAKMRNIPIQKDLFEQEKATNNVVEDAIVEVTLADQLFEAYEDTVVKSFGVTPSVFLRVLNAGKYNKEAIDQAISVTRRAKFNQEITKNIAGFFLRALKDGYTDPKEEAKKKKQTHKERFAKAKKLKTKLKELEEQRVAAIHDVIRQLTTDNPEITSNAIKNIRKSKTAKLVIKVKEQQLDRALEIEDYRQDSILRELVKSAIIELNQSHFQDIEERFSKVIVPLKQELEGLKKK